MPEMNLNLFSSNSHEQTYEQRFTISTRLPAGTPVFQIRVTRPQSKFKQREYRDRTGAQPRFCGGKPRCSPSFGMLPQLLAVKSETFFVWNGYNKQQQLRTASGSPTLGMLVEMLVERVFLVSGVVQTVFCRFKK